MEENNNFQNNPNNVDVNQVNENANQVNQEEKNLKKRKTKTIVLMVIVLIIILAIGILGGIFISGNGDKVTKIINQGTENKEKNEASKKIDNNKPWVYDADYMKENKKIYRDSKKTEEYAVNSDKDLIVPYININSEYAEKVNNNIKALYDDYYSRYGTEYNNPYSNEFKNYYHYELKYDNYINDNILSVVITLTEGMVVVDGGTGGGTFTKYTYNFDLDTLNEATLNDMAVKCGFSSDYEVTSKIKEWESKQREIMAKTDIVSVFEGAESGKYFIDGNGKLNFFYRTVAASNYLHSQPIEKGKDIEFFYTEEDANEHKKNVEDVIEKQKNAETNNISKINLSDENLIYAVAELNDFSDGMKLSKEEYSNVVYNMLNDKIVKIENDSDEKGTMEISEKEIKNIIYSIFGVNFNERLSRGFYENGNYRFEKSDRGSTPVIKNITTDIAGEIKYLTYDLYMRDYNDVESYKGRFQLTVSNTEGYIKSKKIISSSATGGNRVVKRLSPSGWAGSSMQEIRLYENGDVYHVTYNGEGNTEANVVNFELIATNVESIEGKASGQAVEAIIVKGNNINVIKNNESWILFQNN